MFYIWRCLKFIYQTLYIMRLLNSYTCCYQRDRNIEKHTLCYETIIHINPLSANNDYNLFYYQIKSQLLGMKCVFKHQDLQTKCVACEEDISTLLSLTLNVI